MDNLPTNVRVASWLGARCLEKFFSDNKICDIRFNEFCNHISDLAKSDNIPAWDAKAMSLEITGMGDPLPEDYVHIKQLASLVDSVREISGSQIWGKFIPEEVTKYLQDAILISEIDLTKYNLELMCSISSEQFGSVLTSNMIDTFMHV